MSSQDDVVVLHHGQYVGGGFFCLSARTVENGRVLEIAQFDCHDDMRPTSNYYRDRISLDREAAIRLLSLLQKLYPLEALGDI